MKVRVRVRVRVRVPVRVSVVLSEGACCVRVDVLIPRRGTCRIRVRDRGHGHS